MAEIQVIITWLDQDKEQHLVFDLFEEREVMLKNIAHLIDLQQTFEVTYNS